MTGIIYNNNSYTVNSGSTEIEYNSMGGGSVGYSMYGENIPEAPSGRYKLLSWIKLNNSAYIQTTDKYNQYFKAKFCIKVNSYKAWNTLISAPSCVASWSNTNGHIWCAKSTKDNIIYNAINLYQQTGTNLASSDSYITESELEHSDFLYYFWDKPNMCYAGTSYSNMSILESTQKNITSINTWNNNKYNIWLFNNWDQYSADYTFNGYFREFMYLLNGEVALCYRPYLDTEENKVVIIEEVNSTVYEFLGTAPTVYE